MSDYQVFKPGQKVRDRYGEIVTVIRQNGCQVWVNERLAWYHPANLTPITFWCNSSSGFVTIPE